jgi:hypothetical protein
MANDPIYDAVIERAKIHLHGAWDAFCDDPALSWREKPGNAPKVRTQAWVDALKETLQHYEEIERRL